MVAYRGLGRHAPSHAVAHASASTELAAQVLAPLLEALKNDPYGDVRRAASSALGQFSLQQFMEGYWATQNQALIPLIAPQLYHTPLSVQTIPHSQQQRLILYPTAGAAVKWDKPEQEVQRFVQQIKKAAKLKEGFWSRLKR